MGVRKLEEELNLLAGEWVVPAVEGFRTKPIFSDESKDQGVILVLIPKSDLTPHMCKIGKTTVELKYGKTKAIELGHRYYRRSGSSFRVMEHSEIDDMFGRRPKPKLDVMIDISKDEANDIYHLNVSIENKGKATAKEIICRKKLFKCSEIVNNHGPRYNPDDSVEFSDKTYALILKKPVHPDMVVQYRNYSISCVESYARIDFEIYCENSPITKIIKFLGLKKDDAVFQNTISRFPFAFDIKDAEKFFLQDFIDKNP